MRVIKKIKKQQILKRYENICVLNIVYISSSYNVMKNAIKLRFSHCSRSNSYKQKIK